MSYPHPLLPCPRWYGYKASGYHPRDTTIVGLLAITSSRHSLERIGAIHTTTATRKAGSSTKATGTTKIMATAMLMGTTRTRTTTTTTATDMAMIATKKTLSSSSREP